MSTDMNTNMSTGTTTNRTADTTTADTTTANTTTAGTPPGNTSAGGDTDASVAVVYHSGFGHTKVLAEAVHRGAGGEPGVRAHLIAVEDIEQHWADLDSADAIIFGSPTYMGGPSAPFKSFIDATSGRWSEGAWTDKLAAAFTNGGGVSGDKLNTLQSLMTFAMQHRMIWVSLGLPAGGVMSTKSGDELNRLDSFMGAMSQAFADVGPELGPPASDLRTGEALGRRVARAALRWRTAAAVQEVSG